MCACNRTIFAVFLTLHILAMLPIIINPSISDVSLIGHKFEPTWIERGPIFLDGNDDFEEQGFPGSGTADDPFVISGFRIASDGSCIEIRNSDVFFEIKNCFLESPSDELCGTGVKIVNVINSNIESLEISGKDRGIDVYDSENCVLSNISVSDCRREGIYISGTSNFRMVDSRIFSCDEEGVVIHRSDFIYLTECKIEDCESDLIRVDSAANVSFVNCSLERSIKTGFSFYNVESSNIVDSLVTGVRMSGLDCEISNDIHISGLVVNQSFGGVNIRYSQNALVENCLFSHSNGVAVYMYECPYTIIRNSTIKDFEEGIMLTENSDSSVIENCYVQRVDVDGLYFSDCKSCNISRNIVIDSDEDGVEFLNCNNFSLSQNHFQWTDYLLGADGIRIDNCSIGIIASNYVKNPADNGIGIYSLSSNLAVAGNYIVSAENGIRIYSAIDTTLYSNMIDECYESAAIISKSDNVKVLYNRFNWSRMSNLQVGTSEDVEIYLNAFMNAEDQQIVCTTFEPVKWHNGSHGNYWDDYDGRDENHDMIGDEAYIIGNGHTDRYPLMSLTPLETVWENEVNIPSLEPSSPSETDSELQTIEYLLILISVIQVVAVAIILVKLQRIH